MIFCGRGRGGGCLKQSEDSRYCPLSSENEVQPDLLRQGKSAWDLGPGTFGFCFSFFSFFRF